MAPAPEGLVLGQRMDLTIRFGNQQRVQCRACRCYVAMAGSATGTCSKCGTTYSRQDDGLFTVVGLA